MAEKQKQGGALAVFANSGALSIDTKAAVAALAETAQLGSTGSADGKYLSFSGKTGRYSLGREKEDIDPETIFIVEPLATVEGWTCWKGGTAVAKHEWSVFERGMKAVAAGNLADHGPYNERAGEGWVFMMGLGLIDPDDPGAPIKFTINSVSGRNVFSDLQRQIVAQHEETGELMLPLVGLGVEAFTAQGQKNFKPVIDIVGWASRDEVTAFFEGDYTIDDLIEGNVPVADDQVEAEPEQEPEPTRAGRKRRTAA